LTTELKTSFTKLIAIIGVIIALLPGCGGGSGGGGQSSSSGAATTDQSVPINSSLVYNPVINKAPEPLVVEEGADAIFSVIAADPKSLPLTYQWFRDDTEISGENKVSYVLRGAVKQKDNASKYWVLIKNSSGGQAQSQPVALTVNIKPAAGSVLKVESQPKEVLAQPNTDVSFSVVASGGVAPYIYQWKKDGVNIINASQPNLLLKAKPELSNSTYTVSITDAKGQSLASQGAKLIIFDLYVLGSYDAGRKVDNLVYRNYRYGAVWKNATIEPILNPMSSGYFQFLPVNIALSGDDWYALGKVLTTTSDNPRSGFWKNGQPTLLSPDRWTVPTQLVTDGSDVYVSGNCNGAIAQPCYWSNGTLSLKDTSGDNQNSYLNGINKIAGVLHFTSENTLGYGGVGNKRKSYWVADVATELDANHLGVIKQFAGQSYVVGSSTNGRPAIWVNGKSGAVEVSSEQGSASDIFVDGSNVYVAGYTDVSGPTVWKKNGSEFIPTKVDAVSVKSIVVINGNVFNVGESKSGKPVYWRNFIEVPLAGEDLPGSTNSIAFKVY